MRGYFLETLWTGTVCVWVEGINSWFTQKRAVSVELNNFSHESQDCIVITLRFGSWQWSPEKQSCLGLYLCLFQCVRYKTKTVQGTSECSSERKAKVAFHAPLKEPSIKLLEPWAIKRWNDEFEVSLNGVETSCFVEWSISFISRSTVTCRREQLTKLPLNIHFHNLVGAQIRCGIEKYTESACILSMAKSWLTFLSRETFDFTLTEVPFISHWSVL